MQKFPVEELSIMNWNRLTLTLFPYLFDKINETQKMLRFNADFFSNIKFTFLFKTWKKKLFDFFPRFFFKLNWNFPLRETISVSMKMSWLNLRLILAIFSADDTFFPWFCFSLFCFIKKDGFAKRNSISTLSFRGNYYFYWLKKLIQLNFPTTKLRTEIFMIEIVFLYVLIATQFN